VLLPGWSRKAIRAAAVQDECPLGKADFEDGGTCLFPPEGVVLEDWVARVARTLSSMPQTDKQKQPTIGVTLTYPETFPTF
jgi:hypothetical protein